MNGAFGQFGFQAVEFLFEPDQFLLVGGKDLFLQRLALDGSQGADLLVFLSIPIDQGALGDVEPLGDAAQAPAFGSQFEELVFSIVVMHKGVRFVAPLVVSAGARGESSTVFRR